MPSLAELNDSFAIPGMLAFDEPHPGMTRARISTPACTAELYLHGAHVTHWQPAGAAPVLFLSPNSLFQRDKAIRGGIPVIFPWFGARTPEITGNRSGGAQHGFARTAEWQLSFAALAGDDLRLALLLSPDDAARAAGFDHFRVALEFTLGRTFSARMTVANEGDTPLVFEQALHTYIHVGDIAQATVHGLENVEYLDKTDNFARKRQPQEPIRFDGEVDRPFLNTAAPAEVHDPVLARRVVVNKAGSQTTVVWNPGRKLAASLADLGEEPSRRFVCVETANVAEDLITLAPRSAHVMEAHIALASLKESGLSA